MEYNDNSYYPGADAGDEQPKPRKPRRRGMWKLLWLIPVVLLAAGLAMDSFYTLKEDQYAVLTTFGKPATVSASGLQMKIPLVQRVQLVSKSIQGFPLGYREFGDHYAHMKEIFTGGMKELGIPFTDPEGTYFVLADIAPYMKKGQSDVEFCVEMAQKVGVACVPGSSFFDEDVNHIVRLHFAKKDETLLSALDRLSHLKQIMCG